MPLLEVRRLVKHFSRGGGLFAPSPTVVRAVDDVSFAIEEGDMFGLVGESGSGKSTTGRCILRLIEPDSGEIVFRGENVLEYSKSRMRLARRDMQIVFQDPYSSLNPRMRAGDIVEEPLIIHRLGNPSERRDKVRSLFELVGLEGTHLERYPGDPAAARFEGTAETDLPVHRPRSATGRNGVQPRRGHVSWEDRGNG